MDVPVIEQAKIQARVLVPLVKALEAEIGAERAHALVRGALAGMYRELGERWWRSRGGDHVGDNVAAAFATYAAGDALEFRTVEQSADAYAIDVTECRYARFYRALGEPELGFLLVCEADHAVAEGFGGEVTLTRTQTLMQGASHCDFRYARRAANAKREP